MRRTFSFIALAAICLSAFSQQRQQSPDNPSMLVYPRTSIRTEIILPEVNGYKIIKADLHVHTCYSDGRVIPMYRIIEGWQDGLDAIAITDHIEYRPNEKKMKKFLADGVNSNKAEEGQILSDLNFSVSDARHAAEQFGITLIPGTEITRNAVNVGHFNALFTTDNNLIPDPDPLQAIRNAKKQGALVQSNHPGWRKTDNNFTEIAKAALKEGLIDGVEVFNSSEFYPDVIETAVKKDLYISCGSDIHSASHDNYGQYGVYRNMTLILAEDSSAESVRKALENKRTLAYAYGDIAGSEELLKAFFLASFDCKVVYTDKKKELVHVRLTNKTSFPYILTLPGFKVDMTVAAMSSIMCTVKKGDKFRIGISNMWYGADKHPSVEINLN